MDDFSGNNGKHPVRIKIISMGNAEVGKVCSFSRWEFLYPVIY